MPAITASRRAVSFPETALPARWWALLAGVLWFVRAATLGHVLPWQNPIWAGWFDQSRYLTSALAFSRGDLHPVRHWYPLGYPLLAAPFAWILPSDPFLPLDLGLFLLTCRAFQRVVARLQIGLWPATLCFLATTLVQTGLASAWAQPWTTTLSAALIWWLLDRSLAATDAERAPGIGTAVAIGALAAALPLVRPVDALISMTCLTYVSGALMQRRQLPAPFVLAIGLGGLLVCLPYGAIHLAIYGPHATAYMTAAAQTGFVFGDLGWKAYVLLVEPEPWYPGSRSILQVLPWIVPGAAGLAGRAVSGSRQERSIVLLLLATALPVNALMLTYADLQPPGLWYFGNFHYFKWTVPLFGCGLILAWRMMWHRSEWRVLALAAGALLIPLAIRIRPAPVSDDRPARMLVFRAGSKRGWQDGYFASATITDSRGTLRNVGEFHQLPDGERVLAVGIQRPFARHPRRVDPGDPVSKAGETPYARYGERLSVVGLP